MRMGMIFVPKTAEELQISERLGDLLTYVYPYYIVEYEEYADSKMGMACTIGAKITKVIAKAEFEGVRYFYHGRYLFSLKVGDFSVDADRYNIAWCVDDPTLLIEETRRHLRRVGFGKQPNITYVGFDEGEPA